MTVPIQVKLVKPGPQNLQPTIALLGGAWGEFREGGVAGLASICVASKGRFPRLTPLRSFPQRPALALSSDRITWGGRKYERKRVEESAYQVSGGAWEGLAYGDELSKLNLAIVVLVSLGDELLHLFYRDIEQEGLGEEEVELGGGEMTVPIKVQFVELPPQFL